MASEEIIKKVHLRLQMENIILIGMPGCGKTAVGQQLAQKLGKKFVDADESLEASVCRKITDIIPNDGEAAFREMESETLAELGKPFFVHSIPIHAKKPP